MLQMSVIPLNGMHTCLNLLIHVTRSESILQSDVDDGSQMMSILVGKEKKPVWSVVGTNRSIGLYRMAYADPEGPNLTFH